MAVAHANERTRQLALGEVIAGRYRVVGFLGSGGMGEVYEAEHLSLGRHFALKVLRREFCGDPNTVRRFTREARAMASVESEYVVGIVDSGQILDGTPYFVMERLRGRDLRCHLLESGPLSSSHAARVGIDVCMGLQVVHDADLVHRDLKPANIFVTRRDEGQSRCRLLDFGVVKSIVTDSTQQGSFVGTIRYMAPEQILENGIVDSRTDIYALGAILYECLTARAPFEADAVERILFKILNENPPPLTQLRGDIPPDLSATILRALARDPRQRFEDAASFARALVPHAGEDGQFLGPLIDAAKSTHERTVVEHRAPMRRDRRFGDRAAIAVTAALVAISGITGWRLGGRGLGREAVLASRNSRQDHVTLSTATLEKDICSPIHAAAGVLTGPEPPRDEPNEIRVKAKENSEKHTGRVTPKRRTPAVEAIYPLPKVDAENPYGD